MAVELSTTQFQSCQEANGQFCSITTPFQPLANPPSSIALLYAKSTVDITSKCLLQIWKASITIYLPPRYETLTLNVNISLHMANLHMLTILAQDFYIWKHLGSNRSDIQLQHLTTIPSIPVHKIYQHLLNNTLPIIHFHKGSTDHTGSIWTLFLHPWKYVSAIGSLIPVGVGLFCCYFF